MPHQIQGQNGQQGMWMYQCIHCKKNFPSSQAIAGHSKGHFRDGWVKGTPQSKVFVLFSDYQQQQGSTTNSSIPDKQVFSAATSDTDLTDAHQLPKGVQNSRNPAPRAPSPTSSSRQPQIPRHHLRFRDLKILARLRARLTREEQEVILRLLDSAMEQAKQSSKKSTEMDVIPNENSEAAAAAIGTTNKDMDVGTTEESDDESKNM